MRSSWPGGTTSAGRPIAVQPSGTARPGGSSELMCTTALARTTARAPIRAAGKSEAPAAINASSSTPAPFTFAPGPIITSLPIETGSCGQARMTAFSMITVRALTRTGASSATRTAPNMILHSSPISTSPQTTAVGATYADSATLGAIPRCSISISPLPARAWPAPPSARAACSSREPRSDGRARSCRSRRDRRRSRSSPGRGDRAQARRPSRRGTARGRRAPSPSRCRSRRPPAGHRQRRSAYGQPSGSSREDDLATGGLLVELADADDVLDLGDEVLHRQAEHVDGRLAGVEADAGVGDELDELGDRRDVDLLHLPLHHPRDERREPG